ncbi:hypothetical protein PENTCL1PPCAC_29989, partial [Pristionchus entomophagus]
VCGSTNKVLLVNMHEHIKYMSGSPRCVNDRLELRKGELTPIPEMTTALTGGMPSSFFLSKNTTTRKQAERLSFVSLALGPTLMRRARNAAQRASRSRVDNKGTKNVVPETRPMVLLQMLVPGASVLTGLACAGLGLAVELLRMRTRAAIHIV